MSVRAIVKLSSQLSKVVGPTVNTRGDALKGVWAYVKKNNLQNPENKREFRCDANLLAVFKKTPVSMFEVMKLLASHYTKTT